MENKNYNYIKNLRLKTPRTNFLIQRRRVDKGNGSKTLGWLLFDKDSNLLNENTKFTSLVKYKREIEKNV